MLSDNVSLQRIQKDLIDLEDIGIDSEFYGYNRIAFGPAETIAGEMLAETLLDDDFEVNRDHMGNFHFAYPASQSGGKTIHILSHLDSVYNGDFHDGMMGILVAKEALLTIKRSEVPLINDIVLTCLRGEESARFGKPYLGSLGMFGLLTEDDFKRTDREGITLENALKGIGKTDDDIQKAISGVPQFDTSNSIAGIEAHMEQASVLHGGGYNVGLVDSIRGNQRFEITLPPTDLGDVPLAVILMKLESYRQTKSFDLVQTFGVINDVHVPSESIIRNNSLNKVAGFAEVRFNKSDKNLDRIFEYIVKRYGVDLSFEMEGSTIRIDIEGQDAHSGAEPMTHRKDANIAAAALVFELYKEYRIVSNINHNFAGSNAQIDIRSNDKTQLESYASSLSDTIRSARVRSNLVYKLKEISQCDPIEHMNERLLGIAAQKTRDLEFAYTVMASGAGHDIAVFNRYMPTLLLFAPSTGGSHNPQGKVSIPAYHDMAKLYTEVLYQLAK